ncbi:MAG: TSUP family transporter [Flavobacteriales bacterium]
MITYLTVIAAALTGAFLSFFCGFGLGTLLLPAFMLYFPAQVAIAATAAVHMANNVFKLFLVGKHAHKPTLVSFGLPSVAGALLGAWSLQGLAQWGQQFNYAIAGRAFQTDSIRIVIALVILGFALLELSPALNRLNVPKRWFPAGGLLSGFFGGLSGHQGALRSAFLMRAGLSKDAFIGTRVVCACLVDVSRISVYAASIAHGWEEIRLDVLAVATLAAYGGAWQGNKLVKKTQLPLLNKIITVALVLFAIALAGGVL